MKRNSGFSLILLFILFLFPQNGYSYTTEILNYLPSIGEYGDMRIAFPDDWQEGDSRPAIVLAHGGSWVSGTYDAFYTLEWCQYFADQGMVAISINYRLDSIAHAVMDCRSAMRYIKANAYELGVDSSRIAAGGQSAGGHLSYCMYSADGVDNSDDDLSISPHPNLFIFLDGALGLHDGRMDQVAAIVGEELAQGCQPNLNVRSDFPPTLYLYGADDGYRETGHVCYDLAIAQGIRQEMWLAPGGTHGIAFQSGEWNDNCLYLAHEFLQEYGYLSGSPAVSLPATDPVMYEQSFAGSKSILIAPTSVICVPSQTSTQIKENMINGSGISDNPVVQSSYHEFSDEYTWRSATPNLGKVIFDFGEQLDFDQIHLWNYNGSNDYTYLGINEVEISASSGTDTAAANFTILDTLFLFKEGHYCQNYDVAGTDVQLLKFNIISNFASMYTGLNEMRVSLSTSQGSDIVPTHVVLDQLSVALFEGETVQLNATVYPENATNKNVSWESSDESVVTVSETGLVSIVDEGYARVTVSTVSGNVQCYSEVAVIMPKPATGISVDPASINIAQGTTGQLSAVFSPANASNQKVSWESNEEGVASVDNDGLVTGVSVGATYIKVTSEDGGFSDSCLVSITEAVKVTDVNINYSELTLENDESYQLQASISPANATNKSVTWTSSNESVATVDATGFVDAKVPGTTTITVTTDDGAYEATCIITVILDASTSMETFNNLDASDTDYSTGSYTGDNGETWNYERTKKIEDGLTGVCAELRANNGVLETVLPDGIKDLQFTFLNQDGYTSAGYTRITISVNDSTFGTFSLDEIDVAKTVSIEDINFTEPATLRITPGGWYTKIDDITWTLPDPVIAATGIILDRNSIAFHTDEIIDLVATVAPYNASNQTVLWTSSDNAVASVNSNGAVLALAPGTCTITAESEDGGFKAMCSVTVSDPVFDVESVSLNESEITLTEGNTSQLIATINPLNATNQNVTWNSTNTETASVDPTGLVTAISSGETTITVTTEDGGKTASCIVTVPVIVESISLNETSLSLEEGNTFQLNAEVLPEDASNQLVEWNSTDSEIASVNETGLVTAVSAGEATISATTNDGGKTASCIVTVSQSNVEVADISNLVSKVYPNPATQILNIQLSETESNLSIYSVLGKVVYFGTNVAKLTSIDVSNWTKGMYIIKIQNSDTTEILQLIVE